MKRFLPSLSTRHSPLSTAFLLLLATGYWSLATVLFAQRLHIPDPNLRAAIFEALDGAPITRSTMLHLTHLDARDANITNLSGLEHAVNLTFVWLTDNNIVDLSQLSLLTRLEILAIPGNPVQDLSAIANLTNLWSLSIVGTPVTDLRPLARLTKLKELFAHNCQITDISPIANLTQLEHLNLHRNQIVDARPLANLTRLEYLNVTHNQIVDVRPIENLSVANLSYDQVCDVPRLSIQERLENRSLPSIVLAWGDGIGNPDWWDQSLSYFERVATHDLWWHIDRFETRFTLTPLGYQIVSDLPKALSRREELLSQNPNMLFLVDLRQHYAHINRFGADWFGWLRDETGNHIIGIEDFDEPFINYELPEVQDVIVERALAVAQCGLFDGVFYDGWRGNDYSILRRIRDAVSDDFLILFNTNRFTIPELAPYINGSFMETFPSDHAKGYTRDRIIEIETNLMWYEENLREPQINCVRGFGIGSQPPDSPENRRWMRLFTTMSLTCSDGYALYTVGTINGRRQYQNHIWHPFWDADLGQPVSSTAGRYQDIDGLYIREFTNGWALYNRSGAAHVITLPEEAQGVASGFLNTEHALPDMDGEIYLKVKPTTPADVNRDGVVNILDLTLVAQALGTNNARGDVNADGVVNVIDLVFVANQF